MIAKHNRTCTCYRIFADSNRTGYFRTVYYFIVSFLYRTIFPRITYRFYCTLTKIHHVFFSANSRSNKTLAVFIRVFSIPGMCIRTNSNITVYVLSCRTIPNRNMCTLTNGYVQIIRCRITSHRRSHACTGHNTCCNQHCQQLFRRAAFTAMIFRDFGHNNVCAACITPNYFEYFIHIDSSSFLCILAQEIILVCTKHFAAD